MKLAETTYRDVNIGLANDLARFAQARGIDAVAAFRAANTQPFSHLHTPGIGVGGHCIPVYPQFLLAQAAPGELEVVRSARLDTDGKHIAAGGERWDFDVVPKIALNRSYYNAESIAFLRERPLTLRGSAAGGHSGRRLGPGQTSC